MNYSIEAKHITKMIGKNLIIDDVSFKLEKGKIYGLVGANGSGKSTLLKIILGLCNSKGDIFINGNNLKKNFKESLEKIGGIVDYVSFYDFLTAYENLRYFALLYGVSIDRVKEVLNIVNLNVDRKLLVKKFSLGMKQRLGIAISLLKDPDILILDEPTNGLDPKGIIEFRNLLLSLNNKTIIVSSHIISEIEKLASDILFINNKKIYQRSLSDLDRKKIKFKLGECSEVNNIKDTLEKGIYMNEKEFAKCIKNLSDKNVSVYGVKEEGSLEDILLTMMGEDSND